MYGKDLSSRSRMLNGGRWRLTRFLPRWSAPASFRVTMTSTSAIRGTSRSIPGRVSPRWKYANAGAERFSRFADVEDVAGLAAEQVDA